MNPLHRIRNKAHAAVFAGVVATIAVPIVWMLDYLFLGAELARETRLTSLVTTLSAAFVITLLVGLKIMEANHLSAKLDYMASYDFLTGAMTRTKFFGQLSATAGRTGAIMVFDMDNFKQINDTLGHAAGDAALFKVAQTTRNNMGPQDCLCRMGGDEFCAFFPGIDMNEAALMAQWIQQRIANESVGPEGETVALSASFGLAALTPGGDIDAAIAVADAELYHAKARHKREIPAADAGRHIRSRQR